MQQAWSDIEKLLNEMKPYLVEARCKAVQMSERDPNEYNGQHLADVFDWLHQLYLSEAYTNVLAAKALVPESMWQNYKLLGVTGLREQMILESRLRELLKAWKANRPGFFNHKKRHETEQDEHQEGAGRKRV